MTKTNSISKFACSLVEFLINALADKHGNARAVAQKYNNLKVYMDPAKISTPHFYVSVGISEACFAIDGGKKIEGSLGYEDGYVVRWASRSNIHNELEAFWQILKDAIGATDESKGGGKSSGALIQSKLAETANDAMKVDMTGTGIDRSKKYEYDRKKKKFLKRFKNKNKNIDIDIDIDFDIDTDSNPNI